MNFSCLNLNIFDNHLNDKIFAFPIAINDEEKINYLSRNAREYYKQNVAPDQNIKRIIEFMLGRKLISCCE